MTSIFPNTMSLYCSESTPVAGISKVTIMMPNNVDKLCDIPEDYTGVIGVPFISG